MFRSKTALSGTDRTQNEEATASFDSEVCFEFSCHSLSFEDTDFSAFMWFEDGRDG